MKICLATYEGVPLARGGPFVKITEIKKHLEFMGHEVSLFNMWETDFSSRHYDIIHLVGSNFSIYGLARNLKFREKNFLIEPVFYSNRSALIIKSLSTIDKVLRNFVSGIWFDHAILRDICNWAELIVPNTSAEKELLLKSFEIPAQKFEIIPNGVSEKFIDSNPSVFEKKFGIKDFILSVGHIGPERKNILRLVKALSKIDNPSVIIGSKINTVETRHVLSEVKKNKNIILIDELPNSSELLASAYAACKVFVLPSLFETPGIAALEAALSRANIVITPFGGTKDYFNDLVQYVNPFSVEDIRKGIETSLNKDKSNVLSDFVKANFLWDKIAERTIQVYNNIKKV